MSRLSGLAILITLGFVSLASLLAFAPDSILRLRAQLPTTAETTETQTLTWTPTQDQIGTHTVDIQASDGIDTVTKTITINVTAAAPGDATGDGCVNIDDLRIVADNFGQSDPLPEPRADLNGDGVVNATDLTEVTNNFGTCV